MIYFDCPYCNQMLAIDEEDLGADILCPNCQDVVSIPVSRLSPGFILYDFQLKRKLATWDMGKVYLAWQMSLEREVVVKILDPEYNSQSIVEEFADEAKRDAQLNVPHLGQVFFFGEMAGLFFYVMENFENYDQCNTAVFTRQVVITNTDQLAEQFKVNPPLPDHPQEVYEEPEVYADPVQAEEQYPEAFQEESPLEEELYYPPEESPEPEVFPEPVYEQEPEAPAMEDEFPTVNPPPAAPTATKTAGKIQVSASNKPAMKLNRPKKKGKKKFRM